MEPNKEKSQRIGRRVGEVLRDTGLISQEQLEKALEAERKTKKSFLEILRQDVSFQSIKELMTYEIPNPLSSGSGSKMTAILKDSGFLTDDDLAMLQSDDHELNERLKKYFMSQGLLSHEQYATALEMQHKTGLPLWRALINLKYLMPQQITRFLKEKDRTVESEDKFDRFCQTLLDSDLLDESDYNRANSESSSNTEFMTRILEKELVDFRALSKLLKEKFNIDTINLADIRIDDQTLYCIPDSIIYRHKAIPYNRESDRVFLAMVNPFDTGFLDQFRMITSLEGVPNFIAFKDYTNLYSRFYESKLHISQRLDDVTAVRDAAEDVSTVQLVVTIIEGSIKARASDIHLEPMEDGLRVRYRIDGMLYDIMTIPPYQRNPVISRIKILADMDITEKRKPQDGHYSMNLSRRRYNLRISTLPTYLGEKAVIRILDDAKVIRGLQELGLEEDQLLTLERLIHKPHGAVLVTGPIGSGKTTTLYSCLNEIDILHNNIVTIEDPVEYQLPGINQMPVNYDLGIDFAVGLRSILRQDADIIMVGEVRDPETAGVAVWAALTGQLVFSTLHTNDTAGAVTMLSNLKVQKFLIGGAVIGFVSQRLLRKLCPKCKVSFTPDTSLIQRYNFPKQKNYTFWKSVGCADCLYTGFKGLIGVFEIMEITPYLRSLIINDESEETIKEAALEEGMNTLYQNGLLKVLAGETSLDELNRKIAF